MDRIEAREIPWFDGHCDTISRCAHENCALRKNNGHLDLKRLIRYQKAAQVFAIFANAAHYTAGTLLTESRRQHDVFAAEMEKNADMAVACRQLGDVRSANAAGKIAALLSVEGGELLDCDPGQLSEAQSWGVRMVNPTWNYANDLSGSCADEPSRGLSSRGRAFVREADRLGIRIDVSHLSDRGFWDLCQLTSQPIIASHSDARALCGHVRNLTDDMFLAIRDSGGVVGLNFYVDFLGGDGSLETLLNHAEHFLELDGGKTLALGGDWDGCDLGCGWQGIQDVPALWNAMLRRGWPCQVLEDIFYNNWLRVLDGG